MSSSINRKTEVRSALLLLLAATIWGTAFVAQSKGMDYVGPYTFTFVRSIVAGVLLMFLAILKDKYDFKTGNKKPLSLSEKKALQKTTLIGGCCVGLFLTLGSNLQQIGILYTSVGKTGFLTALYIVLVPVFSLILGKKAHINVWISVGIAVIGLYLLCITEEFTIVPTDLYVLACAVMFSFHIITIDHFSPKVNGLWLSSIQFFVCTFFSGILMLAFETPNWSDIISASGSILYAGVLSSAGGYTLQILGQKGLNASFAALIMSLESVVSVLAGWLLLGQILSQREMIGCVLMFIAIIIVQVDFSSIIKNKK